MLNLIENSGAQNSLTAFTGNSWVDKQAAIIHTISIHTLSVLVTLWHATWCTRNEDSKAKESHQLQSSDQRC